MAVNGDFGERMKEYYEQVARDNRELAIEMIEAYTNKKFNEESRLHSYVLRLIEEALTNKKNKIFSDLEIIQALRTIKHSKFDDLVENIHVEFVSENEE